MSFEQAYPYLDQWVMEVLDKLGIKATYVPLNDIASEFGKIGGAAQKRWANGYMVHHVTMAYDIDAIKMNEVLRIGMEKIRDKGTRSAVKRVDPMRSQTRPSPRGDPPGVLRPLQGEVQRHGRHHHRRGPCSCARALRDEVRARGVVHRIP